jgi:hypothetical protein
MPRSGLLARALARRGIHQGSVVAVRACDIHSVDRQVAFDAIQSLGAKGVDLGNAGSTAELAMALRECHPAILVACAHGVDAWRSTGVPLRIVGDGEGVLWWRALELREASELHKSGVQPTETVDPAPIIPPVRATPEGVEAHL